MTHPAPTPDDSQQLDGLASKLAQLQPGSASALQAQVFYRAGMQAALTASQPRPMSHWLARAATVLLLVGCSGASYLAGLSRGERATVAVDTSSTEAVPNVELSSRGPVDVRDEQAVESNAETQSNRPTTGAESIPFWLPIAAWLQLPRVSPEEYLQMVERRTAPARVSSIAEESSRTVEPTKDAWLRELYGEPSPSSSSLSSPLGRWLSM